MLDLQLLLPNSVGFVPMQSTLRILLIGQPHGSNTFELSPPSGPELLAEPRSLTHRRTPRNSLDVANLTNNLEIHSPHSAMPVRTNHLSGPTPGISRAALRRRLDAVVRRELLQGPGEHNVKNAAAKFAFLF